MDSDNMTNNSSSGVDLNPTVIRDNLSCLGKHPFSLSHAYLAFKAIDKNICSIECIKSYPNLMYINLSDNVIEDLTPLENLVALVQLKARNNRLKDCLAFAPKRCSLTTAWLDGQQAVGSLLAMADLTGNEIEFIGDLLHHKFLECLILSSNRISKISGMQNLKYLQILDLSYNKITTIECLEGLLITELNLEGNNIISLNGLVANPRLSVLNVAKNQITSLAPLLSCMQLHNLDARSNQISYIRQVEFLEELEWLKILNLSDNPCHSKQFYRARVVFRLPSLQQLDLTTVSSEEKIRASNLYSADGGDLQYRQNVLAKYYPEERFENFSPFFEDDEQHLVVADLYDAIVGEQEKEVLYSKKLVSEEDYAIVKSLAEIVLSDVIFTVSSRQ